MKQLTIFQQIKPINMKEDISENLAKEAILLLETLIPKEFNKALKQISKKI